MLCALIANCHRDPRKNKPFAPDDFNPLVEKPQPLRLENDKEAFAMLKQMFVPQKERG